MGAVRRRGIDDVLHPAAGPDRRQRRGGGGGAVSEMNEAAVSLPAGYRLHSYPAIGSTNDEAKRLAREGAPEGTLVWAREQTAGRGRRGRNWASPPGNLYLSLLVRPGGAPGRAAQLGFVAALGLGEALDRLTGSKLALRYKWPNDLVANGALLLDGADGPRRVAAGDVFPAGCELQAEAASTAGVLRDAPFGRSSA